MVSSFFLQFICLETIQFRFEFFLKLVILHKTTLILLPLLAKTAFPVTFYTEMHFLALLSPLNGQGWTAGLSVSFSLFHQLNSAIDAKSSQICSICVSNNRNGILLFLRFNSSISHDMSCHGFQSLHATLIYFF